MTAILSVTPDNDLYLFNLPFAVYSWRKLGANIMILWTYPDHLAKFDLVLHHCLPTLGQYIEAPREKMATYAQCSRLYAAAETGIENTEVLITADADMCVFNKEFWDQFEYNGAINIIGSDLVPSGQVPMCYIAMPAVGWRRVMQIGSRSVQQCLDDLLGDIEAENFRGNYWAKDQEEAYDRIGNHWPLVRLHGRAIPGTQFASRRADRDGWPSPIPLDIIDAHLPRPGYTDENFEKITGLFHAMYPNDDLTWMWEYRKQYLDLIHA